MTIIKLILGTLIGIWAMGKVRELDASQVSGQESQFIYNREPTGWTSPDRKTGQSLER
jgi:hypothetical protein